MMFFRKTLLLFLLITLIYKPEFIFIPHSVNMFFGFLGLFFVIKNKKKSRFVFKMGKISIHTFLKLIAPFVLVSFFSIMINGSIDLYYPRYAVSLFLGFYSFYLIALLFYKIYGKMSFQTLSDYFVLSECIFLSIGLLSFFFPGIYEYLINIQKFNEISQEAMDRTEGARIISIGAQFFTASIINGFSLIIIAINFLLYNMSNLKKTIYILSFLFIFVVGMMMGRSTIVGALIGFFLMAYSLVKGNIIDIKFIFSLVCAICLLYITYVNFISTHTKDYEYLAEFGFEIFINYNSGNGFHAHSNERLIEMYNTIPDNLKTWIIGDAKWSDGDHYYKNVDVGYLRAIWYFGIVGLFALFYYYVRTIYYYVFSQDCFGNKKSLIFYCLLVYIIVLNFKGPVDLFFLLLPFMYCTKYEIETKKY